MRQFQPVIWSKGTFLSPQHLQTQERFVEDCSRFYLDSLHSWGWGFRELAIDNKALSEGRLSITSASGIFPDALPIDIPGSEAPPPARVLNDCFSLHQESCLFYIAVPEYLQGGMNVAIKRGDVNTRFVAQSRLVRDENSGASEKPVQIAQKNLRLLAENENPEGSVVMGCVRINRSVSGSYELDHAYIPPLIDIHGHRGLERILSGIVELLVSRAAQLSGSRSQKNQDLAEFSASDIANFWMLYTINSHLPALRHILESKGIGPERLFLELSGLAGALTAFSNKIAPQDLPIYKHEDLGSCFAEIDRSIRTLLETVIPRNFVALPLIRVRDNVYATSIEKDAYFDDSLFYLAVSSDLQDAELIDRVPRLVKSSSASQIETLITNALPGLRLRYVTARPRAIPLKLRHQYFSIEKAGPLWKSMQRSRNFAVYVPAEIPNPQMELIILLSKPE
jgi:type VI secretion system protein ImpJ